MLKNISNLGKPLSKTEQQNVHGGIFNSLAECKAECNPRIGICVIGFFGNRWACFE